MYAPDGLKTTNATLSEIMEVEHQGVPLTLVSLSQFKTCGNVKYVPTTNGWIKRDRDSSGEAISLASLGIVKIVK